MTTAVMTKGFQLTADDLTALDWLSRFTYMTNPMLARMLGRSEQTVTRRVRRLVDAKLVRRVRWLQGSSDLLLATGRGIMTAGYVAETEDGRVPDLFPGKVSAGVVEHNLSVADLAVSYYLMGHGVRSEREIQRLEVRGRTPGDLITPLSWAAFPRPGRSPYVPDLVVLPNDPTNPYSPAQGDSQRTGFLDPEAQVTYRVGREPRGDGNPIEETVSDTEGNPITWQMILPVLPDTQGRPMAIEVELSPKRPAEYATMLNGYRASNHLSGVVWFTNQRHIALMVARSTEQSGLTSERVRVTELLTWASTAGVTP